MNRDLGRRIGSVGLSKLTQIVRGSALAVLVIPIPAKAGLASPTTTIYANRYFEVRDHDRPTKYVFDGSTRVAEVTGSLSGNQRLQRLRLFPGWNLCSLAVSGPLPTSGTEAISAAYRWNPETGSYSPVSPGQAFVAGAVLWIQARTNAVVSILGTYSDPVALSLHAGGAYLPGAGLEAWSPTLTNGISSWDFDASTGQWSDHLSGDLAAVSGPLPMLSPGQAFYIQTLAPASLAIPDPTLRVRYYHQDHLGSSSVITDDKGAIVQETAFLPFGCPRNQYTPRHFDEPYQFTQKERDQESGLQYFEARYFASAQPHFISPDVAYASPDLLSESKLMGLLQNPQLQNLYTYAINSPLRYRDPSGLDVLKLTEEQKQAVLTAQTSALSELDYAIHLLQTGTGADKRVKEFFGTEGLARKKLIARNLQIVRNNLAEKGIAEFSYTTTQAKPGEMAHVERGGNERFFLTSLYFQRPEWGLDSRPGLLLHEDTHLPSTLSTVDLSESYAGSVRLARRQNGSAFDNAKNYQYLVETLDADRIFNALAAAPFPAKPTGSSSAPGFSECQLCRKTSLTPVNKLK